jgi:pyrimidine-nucleoside phosphorylase
MRMIDIIEAKRDGRELKREQLAFFIREYVSGGVPDYQAAAFAMAVYFKGLSEAELAALTEEMIDSGQRFDLSQLGRMTVDKHSTGGVGDKISLILAPLAAAAGVPVPMVSGRGLGHTGGTLDKLEAIPGFNTRQDYRAFLSQLQAIGVAMIGQTDHFVPADKKLYALRDVTGAVPSLPLIAASIISKKVASGAGGLVLDVKTGSGAFMAEEADARRLAETLVKLGRRLGMQVAAYLTDMNQPLGCEVGNANEVVESLETLKGRGPEDLTLLTETLCAEMLVIGGVADSLDAGLTLARETLNSGRALEKFRALIEAQGGDPRVVDDYALLGVSEQTAELAAPRSGWLTAFDNREIGNAACLLGAGREKVDDEVDHGVGITVLKKLGDAVEEGEPVFRLAWREAARRDACLARLEQTFTIAEENVPAPPLIKERLA